MRVYLSSEVVFSAMKNQLPASLYAQTIMRAIAHKSFIGCISSTDTLNLYRVLNRFSNDEALSKSVVSKLLSFMEIVNITREDYEKALLSATPEFEKNVMKECFLRNKIDCIVSEDVELYKQRKIPVYLPEEFIREYLKGHN